MSWLIIGSFDDPRVQSFQHALEGKGLRPAQLTGYQENWSEVLPRLLTKTTYLRIEAPSRLVDVRHLMKLGALTIEHEGLEAFQEHQINDAHFEQGEFFAPHQFYFGLSNKLNQLYELIQQHPIAGAMNHIPDVLTFFDKQKCHQRLHSEKIALPNALYDVKSYNDLRQKMLANNIKNVFVKTRFGSGASGIIALKTNGSKLHAVTTVEQANNRLYNTLRLRRSNAEGEISALVNKLCKWGVHCESWVPKAKVNEKETDCRILLIGGNCDFMILRKSATPITNLHLLNERANIQELLAHIDETAWQRVLKTCGKIADVFPQSFQFALDLTLHRNLKDHKVLELNAFGDFLQNIQHKKMNTHEWQLEAFMNSTNMAQHSLR